MIPTPIRKQFQFGDQTVIMETGEIARQADGAVLINMDDTVVLVTVVVGKKPATERDFFPLTVDYQEKTYAAGRIPGGFFRREGRPSENEILTSRLIDRPMRPLFPEGFTNEVQIIATVKSLNPAVNPEIPAMIGTSAALAVSGVPFNGPIGAARVGYKDGEYLLNPRHRPGSGQRPGPGRGRYRARRPDGGVRGPGAVRRGHAGRRAVRARADAGGDPGHPGAGGRGR